MINKSKLFLWGPVFFWAGFIYILSGIPSLSTGLGLGDLILRKIAHIVEYGVLAGLLWRGFERDFQWASPRIFWVVSILSLAYAVSDEWHQSFVPGRYPSAFDVSLDFFGAFLMNLFQKGCQQNFFSILEKQIKKIRENL